LLGAFLFGENMNPTTAGIYAQGQQMANQFNAQSQQYGQQYGNDVNQAQGANANLQAYTNNLPDLNQQYGQNLSNAQSMYGYNPQQTAQATNQLTAIQNQIANLPTATQQMSNYSGATAGQTANLYSNLLGNMQPGLTNANNSLTNLMGLASLSQTQANQQTGLGLQGEQLKSQNLQDIYANALSQQQSAQSQMQYFANLYQQQGTLSAQQAAQYGAAQASYAAAQQSLAQAALINLQVQQNQPNASKPSSTNASVPSSGLKVTTANPGTLSLGTANSRGLQGGNINLQ
jgi:hypothetical protein